MSHGCPTCRLHTPTSLSCAPQRLPLGGACPLPVLWCRIPWKMWRTSALCRRCLIAARRTMSPRQLTSWRNVEPCTPHADMQHGPVRMAQARHCALTDVPPVMQVVVVYDDLVSNEPTAEKRAELSALMGRHRACSYAEYWKPDKHLNVWDFWL